MKTQQKIKQLGQGMTEYIIIVALIAIAAITVYNLFGDTVRGQVGNMAQELGGSDSSNDTTARGNDAAAEQDADYGLDDFQQDDN
ncbi:hypothetical protein [Gilvimarinus polysaccharolyticus]|uniref:hypothetical protein n=1 Tax=Gilvimarinus polysaccharolyticus TaxID=863921 RepID=UPI0006736E03|nr:hypothetical protein [Gilvimarinus polysaccharolyticus]